MAARNFYGLRNKLKIFCMFMNKSVENRYERYVLADDWNLTPTNYPVRLTNYVIIDHVVAFLRMCYGEVDEENDNDVPTLPPDWGDNNFELLNKWIDVGLLSNDWKFELGLSDEGGEGNYEDQLA